MKLKTERLRDSNNVIANIDIADCKCI